MTLREALLLLEVVPNSFIFFSSTNNEFVVHVYFKNNRYCVVKSSASKVTEYVTTVCDRCEVELLPTEAHECTPFVDIAEVTIKKWLPHQALGSFIVEGKWYDVSLPISLDGGE
jgi:hypothetical protein